MTRTYRHSNEEFIEAVAKATMLSEVSKHLGLDYSNNQVIKRRIQKLKLNTDHFHKWGKGIPKPKTKNLEEVFSVGIKRESTHLKNLLLRHGILEYKCSVCSLNKWLDKPITLQLDHIDGDTLNNTLENLRLLCPNCHSQTETFTGRNSKNRRKFFYAGSKLTEKQVEQIFERVSNGEKLQSLSDEFDVCIQTISNIKHKKQWKYLLEDL